MTRIVLITFFIFIAVNSYSQIQRVLPILKSVNDTLDIRYDDYLNKKSWILIPKKKTDILPIEIDERPIKVTFISSIDSISFTVNLGDNYDFIILKGTKKYLTRVEGRQALMTSKDDSLATLNLQCLKTNLLSAEERYKQYPFNKAKRIELISFTDTTSDFAIALPVKNYRLNRSKIRDEQVLDTAQVNALTYIWFNIGRTPVANLRYTSVTRTMCYEPRNGIIFIDGKDRVFEYVEICFTCKQNRYSSKRIKPWEDCEQKYDILRGYFAGQGVKFGVEEREF